VKTISQTTFTDDNGRELVTVVPSEDGCEYKILPYSCTRSELHELIDALSAAIDLDDQRGGST